jgi:hypothetical protein
VPKTSKNIFNNIPALAAPKLSAVRDELQLYLAGAMENMDDPLHWWSEKRMTYP